LERVQSWKVEKVKAAERQSARSLVSACGLPRGGLDDAELWCVKEEGGRILGVAGLETWGSQGLLRSVAVDEGRRKGGVGTSLVRQVIVEARKKRLREVYLITETAPLFFERLGFGAIDRSQVTGDVLNSVEFKVACSETAPVMRKDLRI
jgi:amino-acid N-acetyltransferase